MGLLDRFERGLERVVNGAFAKTFKSGVQPLEIASALRRELDTKAAVVSRERILVPNQLRVVLSSTDYASMQRLGESLTDELTSMLQKHAVENGYSFAGGIDLSLNEDESLSTGILRIESENVKGEVRWNAVVDIKGNRYALKRGRTVLGRGSESDIVVDDSGASRVHAEILWDGSRAQAKDLGSTNGTLLNGKPLKKALLEPDSIIDIGNTRIVYRVLAESKGSV
ncbi:FhaA domain-containing protein [Humidisolicoccus flavus]|uniref:FhaA domain-containing protein n=1 Tax=Humidisolicoccus flavus TaxID=3111414 RepID=UPI0032502C9D